MEALLLTQESRISHAVLSVLKLPELRIVKPSDTRWLLHEHYVRDIYRALPALIVTLQQLFETSGDAEAYGIGPLLATYTGVASIVFLSEVLDTLARMNVSMQRKLLNLSRLPVLLKITTDQLEHLMDERKSSKEIDLLQELLSESSKKNNLLQEQLSESSKKIDLLQEQLSESSKKIDLLQAERSETFKTITELRRCFNCYQETFGVLSNIGSSTETSLSSASAKTCDVQTNPGLPTSAGPNFRTLGGSLPPTAATHTQSFPDGQACEIPDHSKPLTCDDLRKVFNSVESVSPKCDLLAIHLGLKSSTSEKITADNRADSLSCLMCVLTQWLNLDYDFNKLGRPSWKLLSQSVKQLDYRLFEELTKCHSIS